MKKRLFGTDGIRGEAGIYPMTPEIALKVGRALGYLLKKEGKSKVIIGKDTRISGYIFENALTSGLCSMGINTGLIGPLTTPGIAFLTRDMRADAGIVVSASHNPYYDNGIKIFDQTGFKLSDEKELEIENLVFDPEFENVRITGKDLGRAFRIKDALGRYIVFLKSVIPPTMTLEGLKVVIDCANGAAYQVGPLVLSELGAEVIPIFCSPDGININENCGALYPENLRKQVLETGANIGIALDGDGDRVLVVNEKGEILDGDDLLAIFGKYLTEKGLLAKNLIVGTIMSNLGLEIFVKETLKADFIRTPVGDKYVSLKLLETGGVLGGENSGHIIFMDKIWTGDGLLTALNLLKILKENEKPLSEILPSYTKFPQIMKNIKVSQKVPPEEIEGLKELISKCEKKLGRGRIIVRPSGTEPKYRIMVEGEEESLCREIAEEIAHFILKKLA